MRCTFSSRRSKMPSATVGSPSASCHMATGSWLVTMVDRSRARSSMTSSRSARLVGVERSEQEVVDGQDVDAGPGGHGSRGRRPSARAMAISSEPRGPRR